ncbi:MAG TPA: EF-hand domain-containing protein [Thermohalobaculum sp.]|nr:EF-hand domain-containing protein [Thermohalobaculum sp.]
MKRPFAYALIAVAVLGAGTSLALAQGGHSGGRGHGDRMMRHLDLNGDGGISPDEANAVRAVHFLRLDTDGDGIITEAEMLERMQKRIAERIAKRFAMMDQNGDGRVERAEFEETGTARFKRLDADGDGRVSTEEFRAQQHGRGRGKHDDTLPVE